MPDGLRWPIDQLSGRAPLSATNELSRGSEPSPWIRTIFPRLRAKSCAGSNRIRSLDAMNSVLSGANASRTL